MRGKPFGKLSQKADAVVADERRTAVIAEVAVREKREATGSVCIATVAAALSALGADSAIR